MVDNDDKSILCDADLNREQLRELLQELRSRSGYSTLALAERMRVRRSTVYSLLRRDGPTRAARPEDRKQRRSINLESLVQFAKANDFEVKLVFSRKVSNEQ